MPIANLAEWMIVFVCLPGTSQVPAGIVIFEKGTNRLAVKLKAAIETEDEAISAMWKELPEFLIDKAQNEGADLLVDAIETMASHVVRLSMREPLDLGSSSLSEHVESLYRQYIES